MTKAEAFIHCSPLWQEAGTQAKTRHDGTTYIARVYERVPLCSRVERRTVTHRLVCDSYYGDSMLSVWDDVLGQFMNERQVEHNYDVAPLADLV